MGREYEFLGKDDGVSGVALVPVAGARPVHISLFPHRKPRAPEATAKPKGAEPPPAGSDAGEGKVTPPPDDRGGPGSSKKELDETRERRKKAREKKKITPPSRNEPRSGGGTLRPRDPRSGN
jgi:hypothetical protein